MKKVGIDDEEQMAAAGEAAMDCASDAAAWT